MKKRNPKAKLLLRHRRIRSKIHGTAARPRLSVSRSLKYIRAQLIDDEKGFTVASASDLALKVKGTKRERAHKVGVELAKKASALGIAKVIFDRGGHKYHGRVREVAEGARKGGIKF